MGSRRQTSAACLSSPPRTSCCDNELFRGEDTSYHNKVVGGNGQCDFLINGYFEWMN